MQSCGVIEDRKIRMAIIGCGRISKNHLEAIEKHRADVELIAFCDVDADTLNQHVSRYKVNGYSGMSELIEAEELDLIILCTKKLLGVKVG